MRRGALAVAALSFAVLGAAWWQRSRALRDDARDAYDRPLLPELRPERVLALRVDLLARGVQLRLERDARGSWFLTDPIAYPAEDALVEKLLAVAARERGTLDRGADPARLGLDPPRAVLELDVLEEPRPGTPPERRTRRVELGADDLDPRLQLARVPAHPAAPPGASAAVLRIPRTLGNTLARAVDDWRDPRLTPLAAGDVRRLVRRGAAPLDVERDEDGGWRARESGIRLDPDAVGLLVRVAAEMRATGFVSDAPGSLSGYGLDPPAFELELSGREGAPVLVRFGHGPQGARWFAARADLACVFAVEATDMGLLQRPEEALWDQTLVRFLRTRLVALALERPGGALRLEREAEGWRVVEGERAFPADEARVEELLASLERARVETFVPGLALREGERAGAFALELDDGSEQGALLGPAWSDAARGVEGRVARRLGEAVCGVVDPALLELVATPAEALRSRRAHLLRQNAVARVTLLRGEERRGFEQVGARWRLDGLAEDAPQAFLDRIDALLGLHVERWLGPGDEAPLADAVQVEIEGAFGPPVRFALGRGADGRPACRLDGGASGVVSESLVAGVLGLFESS